MNYNQEIEQLIGQPKSEILEYEAILQTSKSIAELICSFANTKGGFIVFGVSGSLEIIGLSGDFHADPITNKAISLLSPQPVIYAKYIIFKQKRLYVIEVEKSEDTIRLDGKKYIRIGTETKFSEPTELSFNADGYIYESHDKWDSELEGAFKQKYYAYDINLSESYKELVSQLQDVTTTTRGLSKDEYLSRIKGGVDSYCKHQKLGNIDSGLPVILRYPAYNFHAHLAFQLMTFDVNKIGAMLDFQHKNFVGLDEFQKIVEHGVYDWIKHNSPFDNTIRLQKIMDWVEKSQEKAYEKNKIAESVGAKVLAEFKKINAGEDDILMLGIVQDTYNNLKDNEKKLFNAVFNGMLLDGFIKSELGEPDFIRLGDKGYSYLYENANEDIVNEEELDNSDLPIVVILTAIKEEYAAVRAHLDPITVVKKNSILYEQGIFSHNGRAIAKVAIKQCGPRNPRTAQETERAIMNFHPKCIFFVGIAGSRKPDDFGIGDVIFPVNVHYYEGGKSKLNSNEPRPDDVKPTYTLENITEIEQHKPDWKQLIKGTWEKDVSLGLGVIASGEQVVEHYDSDIGKILSQYYGDTACVAMEEYGFLNSVRCQGVEFATMMAGVVRGVSDILERVEESNNTNATTERRPANNKKFASDTAAAFAYWLILKVIELENQ